jgi:hypothetical protein
MANPKTYERRVFRPAVGPVFSIIFAFGLVGGLLAFVPDTPLTIARIAFALLVTSLVSAAATLFVWWVTAEVLSPEGVEIWSVLGRRLLPWQDLVAIRPFPHLRLLCLRFQSTGWLVASDN